MHSKGQQRLYIVILVLALLPTIAVFAWGVQKAMESPEFSPQLFQPMQ